MPILMLTGDHDRLNPPAVIQRAWIYFGMSGLLVPTAFSTIMTAFGYDTLLEMQPATVDLGFCIFLTVPTRCGFLLAIFLLWLYPLHGKKLQDIRETLTKKKAAYPVPQTD